MNRRIAQVLLVVVVISLSSFYAGIRLSQATSSPTVPRTGTGGGTGPCSWFITIDSTKPVAEAMIGGLSVNPGDNVVGTASEDIGTFTNGIMSAGAKYCFGKGTFPINAATPILVNVNNVTIAGVDRESTEFLKTGNGDGIDVTGNAFTAYDFSMFVGSPQASGVGIKLCKTCTVPGSPVYWPVITRVTIGGWYGSGTQSWFTGMYVTANYASFTSMIIANFVNSGVIVDGQQNDEHFTDIQMGQANFGAASNPLYCFKINWSQAAYYTNILTSYCKYAFFIDPQNTEAVFWQYFTNLQLADTTGMHFWTGTSGTGQIRQLHFTNYAVASDCENDAGVPGLGCVGASKELPSTLLQNVQAATIEGGEIAGNTWEGIVVNGTTTDVDIHGLQVRDNNLANNVGINGLYLAAPTPNAFIDDSVLRLRWIGGSLDNPGIGGVTGHAGGVYFGNTGCPQNCYFNSVGFLTSVGGRMANPFGCLAGCQGIAFDSNFGFDPFGAIASPFATTGVPKTVGICTGCSANPTTTINYTVAGFNLFLNSTGGTGVTIYVRDFNLVVAYQGATANYIYVPIGYQVEFKFSGLPTVKIFGN